jgi:hypothetical protein
MAVEVSERARIRQGRFKGSRHGLEKRLVAVREEALAKYRKKVVEAIFSLL